jgi:hypothetical protein
MENYNHRTHLAIKDMRHVMRVSRCMQPSSAVHLLMQERQEWSGTPKQLKEVL